MYAWINPIYLAEQTQASIRQQFEDDSEIQLENFLLPDKYAAVSAALRESEEWEVRGPANRRRAERCRPERLPAVVAECLALMRSEAVFLVLSQLTGLVLHPLAVTSPERRDVNGAASGSQESDSDSEDDKGQWWGRQGVWSGNRRLKLEMPHPSISWIKPYLFIAASHLLPAMDYNMLRK